jgi:SAM-dependent methyltransferase
MKVLNPEIRRCIEDGHGLRLNLGGGARRLPGYFSLDCVAATRPDILADLNEPLTELPDNSVDAIYARHTLEHITRFMDLLQELHRVTRPDGQIEIIVPHFSNPFGYSDPTHVRFFGLYSFYYFCAGDDQPRRKVPSFYCPVRFRVQSVRFHLLKESVPEKLLRAVVQPWINRKIARLDWYERRVCRLFPVSDVRCILQPVKAADAFATSARPARVA